MLSTEFYDVGSYQPCIVMVITYGIVHVVNIECDSQYSGVLLSWLDTILYRLQTEHTSVSLLLDFLYLSPVSIKVR